MLKKVTAMSFELTTDKQDVTPMNWPYVTYLGTYIFDLIYNDDHAIPKAFGHWLCSEWQECYLGYIADGECFVIGFDTWPDAGESDYNVFRFSISHGTIHAVEPIDVPGRMVYYDRQLPVLHAMYPSLIDLRLD